MDNGLLNQLQEWTNKIPLIILGSGASVPFGLPSMWKLGEHLRENISFADPTDHEEFEEFKKKFDENGDLEATLSKLNLGRNVLGEIINVTWGFINNFDLLACERILNNEIQFPLADLIGYLINTANKRLTILTTNYDRLAEYAASRSKTFICSGFSQNYIGHFSKILAERDLSRVPGCKGQVNIWKVHGSLDWFRDETDQMSYVPARQTIPKKMTPVIVTPGPSKYERTHAEPFRTILAEADTSIENANGYLCIGYGFNDDHVQTKLISQLKHSKPIIVVTKELTPKTKEVILNGQCKKYILIDKAEGSGTRIFSSYSNEELIIENVNYWKLEEFIKLIRE